MEFKTIKSEEMCYLTVRLLNEAPFSVMAIDSEPLDENQFELTSLHYTEMEEAKETLATSDVELALKDEHYATESEQSQKFLESIIKWCVLQK